MERLKKFLIVKADEQKRLHYTLKTQLKTEDFLKRFHLLMKAALTFAYIFGNIDKMKVLKLALSWYRGSMTTTGARN